MLVKTNLKHLVLRIKQDEEFLIRHPEDVEMIKKDISKQMEYIIQCVMENEDNPLLEKIQMK